VNGEGGTREKALYRTLTNGTATRVAVMIAYPPAINDWFRMILRLLVLACAFLIAANAVADPVTAEKRKAVLAGLSKKSTNEKIVSWKVNILNLSGDWAFADVTPLDKAGHPLAEQKVAVLHHIRSPGGADKGWKELDLSKVPTDPNEEEYGPGFQKNIRKTFPFLPKEIFQKR
jgi:hypothetical protein